MTVTARVSNGASRHAMPSIPELVYAALLYKDDETPVNPPSTNFVKGTDTEDGKLNFSFPKPWDTSVKFTLEIFAFVKTEGESTPQFSRGNALLFGNKTGCEIKNNAIEVTDPIALSSDRHGTVNLKITVPSGCTLEIDDTTHFAITGTSPNFILTQKDASGISAGAYPLTFTVKKGEEIVHIFSEYINVINGLCTDTWWNGEKSSEVKEITQSMISSTVYVRGEGGWYSSSDYNTTAKASDGNSGSFLAPFATIQKAVDTVIARNDGESAYTIYVDGTFTATSSAALADFNALSKTQKLSVKIAGLSASEKAVLDGGGLASGIVVGKPAIYSSAEQKNMNLTLENLVIQNAISTNAGYGGAIMLCCKADNSHTIKKCEIKNNNAAYGSAIYNEYASLDLQECLISDNTTTNGGTVCLYKGARLTISNDVRIENNTSRYYAGGVFVGKDSEFRMNGGAIIGNKATLSGCGGGVYVDEGGKFTMSGGTISGNSATMQGGGVYISANSSGMGAFKMSGEASIPAGDDGKNDVYLKASGTNIATITVAGALTAATPVATITPSAYTAERQVLSAGENISEITQDICDQFALTPAPNGTDWKIVSDGTNGVLKTTTVYVRGSGEGWYTDNGHGDITGSDSNSGDRLHPFATIQKAVDTVIAQNDGASAYTIYVDGTLDGTTAALLGTDGMADFSALDKKLTLTIKALSETTKATLDGGARFNADGTVTADGIKKSIIYANPTSGTLNLTLENLVITGGKTDAGSGGGIDFYSTGGSLTMKGCEVRDNEANYGGGIYASSALEMESCTVSGNTAARDGGGINLDGNAVTMKDCEITGNTATRNGGGIYIEGSAATLTMENGKISENIASDNDGGGIYVKNGTFTMTGGTIEKNEANYGGGVYVNGGTFNMSGDGSAISRNKARGNAGTGDGGGGGIYLKGATFKMSGGTVSENETAGSLANSGGGGVYVYKSTFTMSGGTFSGNKANSGLGRGAFVHPDCTFNVSGTAQFADDNDIYHYSY